MNAARAVLEPRGSLQPPAEFDLEFVQLATDVARLKLRMKDAPG